MSKKSQLIREWRPDECNTRLGDVVLSRHGIIELEIKCRRCSKLKGSDQFHTIALRDPNVVLRLNKSNEDLISIVERAIALLSEDTAHALQAQLNAVMVELKG